MGLDSVELLLLTEGEFQIAISDEEAAKCETPGMLTDLVYSKLRKSKEETCPSMQGFYLVRKVMIEKFGFPRELIKPETKLDELITRKNRKATWEKLLKSLSNGKTIYAPLKRPRWISLLMVTLSLVAFIVAFMETESGSLSVIFSLLAGSIFHGITTIFKVEFANEFMTVKALIRIVGTLDTKVWSRREVYDGVRKLVAEQLGVNESDIQPDSHFVHDLGMG